MHLHGASARKRGGEVCRLEEEGTAGNDRNSGSRNHGDLVNLRTIVELVLHSVGHVRLVGHVLRETVLKGALRDSEGGVVGKDGLGEVTRDIFNGLALLDRGGVDTANEVAGDRLEVVRGDRSRAVSASSGVNVRVANKERADTRGLRVRVLRARARATSVAARLRALRRRAALLALRRARGGARRALRVVALVLRKSTNHGNSENGKDGVELNHDCESNW